jgi:hypothetical protein
MKRTFEEVATALATTSGAYTLWVGAGASIAATGGRTPGWQALIDNIRTSYGIPADTSATEDMPAQIERLSESIGHAAFRRELRQRLVDAIRPEDLVPEILAAQAVIGARAASIVSFNIEPFSAVSFVLGRGGSFSARTFLEHSKFAFFGETATEPGLTAPPIYFPHGLLMQANVVMTKSEYDKYLGGFAVATATHLAIGGDLVIIGMSLGDSYLRDALLKNRTWLRDVYWVGASSAFGEWARMARITLVDVHYSRLWTDTANIFCDADPSGAIGKIKAGVFRHGVDAVKMALNTYGAYMPLVAARAQEIIANPGYEPSQITAMAQFFVDSGHDVPDFLRNDPRCNL